MLKWPAFQSNYYKDLSILLEGQSDDQLRKEGKSYVHPPPIQRAWYKDFLEGNPNGWSLFLNLAGCYVLYSIESAIFSLASSAGGKAFIFALQLSFIMCLSWGFKLLLQNCKLTEEGEIMFNE